MTFTKPPIPWKLETQLIAPEFTRRRAVTAAMMSAAYAAMARIAEGATWEGEPEIVIDPGLGSHADRMALIWKRAAENLQCGPVVVTPPRPRIPVDLDKGISRPCRSRRPIE